MKNKFITILLILMLSISLVACGENEEPTQSVEKTEQTGQQEEEPKAEQMNNDKPVDKTLEGGELLKSLSNERPEKLMIKSEMISFGMATKITTYYDGENSRTEMDVPDMSKSILIHLPSEGEMYSYVYGEASGVKMTGVDTSYAEEMGLMMDNQSMFAEIVEASSKDMIARVENLDGEEVIYIEATESDEDMGEVLVKMWYSEKYATPLKYEVIMGEQVMAELKVTKITDSVKMDESLFVPPSDVVFEEMDSDSMFDMMNE